VSPFALVVVAALAVVQSTLGVGLLVFGTPTLLIAGYTYPQALAILLPASLAISLLQVWRGGRPDARFILRFSSWCLVPLALTLVLVLAMNVRAGLNVAVALLLFLFALSRASASAREAARTWMSGRERPWLVLTGIIHGLSNLGGATLIVLSAARHRSKGDIRGEVAFCYTCFAFVQLVVLAALTPDVFGHAQIAYAAVAATLFLTVGQRVFRFTSESVFDGLITVLAVSYAALLAWRSVGQR
jgi:hypothetical protein